MELFGFIGVGNMGFPMLKAVMEEFGKDEVIYFSNDITQLEAVKAKTGLSYEKDIKTLVKKSRFIVTAVKPQQYKEVFLEIKDVLNENHILLSPMAGVSTKEIRENLGFPVKAVRFMPNTAAAVYEAMSCVCYSDHQYTEEEKEWIKRFFGSFGKYIELPEKLMNAGVCANGSSPAYVYIMIEALADSVVKYGIPRETAYQLVSQTVLGAAKMVLETGMHPAVLKDQVCSPGGTTITGISALEENAFRNALIKATDACYNRAEQLAGN